MRKQPWEMDVTELDEEIRKAGELFKTDPHEAKHLLLLHNEREERLIEQEILEGSRYAQDVLQVVEPTLDD